MPPDSSPYGFPESDQQILLLGDSLTDSCYPFLLDRRFQASGYPIFTRVLARDGYMTHMLYSAVKRTMPVLSRRGLSITGCVILIGTNDLKQSTRFRPDTASETIRGIISELRAFFPQAFIICCTVPIPGAHPCLPPDVRRLVCEELNPRIRNLVATEQVSCCELEGIFSEHPEYGPDGIHPSSEGEKRPLCPKSLGNGIVVSPAP